MQTRSRPVQVALAGVLVLTAAVGVGPAEAHVVGLSYADILLEETSAQVSLRVPAKGLSEHFRLKVAGDPPTGGEVLRVGRETLAAFFPGKVEVVNRDRACQASLPTLLPDDDGTRIRVDFAFACQERIGDEVGVYFYFFSEFGPQHSTLATVRRGETVKKFVFSQERTDFHPFRYPGHLAQAWTFVLLGVEHLVTGYDHILFLLGLLLIWRGVLNIVKIVTSFTIAHSITLFAAALEVVTLPSRLVESVIAASIAYVGVENLFAGHVVRRWRVAFLFGLMHGFGFAGTLREMGLPTRGLVLSLFSFNVGVEIGQLAIVVVFFPLIYFAQRRAYWGSLVRGLSIGVFLMGMVWLVQRAFLGVS